MDGEIIFNIDVMLAKRKMSVTELAEKVGITIANVSVLKNGKAKALKISTLINKICLDQVKPSMRSLGLPTWRHLRVQEGAII